MAKETKTTVEDIFAEGEEFPAGGNKYKVLPLVLTDAVKYGKESLYAYKSMAYIIDPDGPMRERVDYWFEKALRTSDGGKVTVTMIDGVWTTKELRKCLELIGELSG